jgi:transaldolase
MLEPDRSDCSGLALAQKDPTASDVLYIKALAAPFTVNTIPDKTLLAFADHGSVGEPMAADGGDAEDWNELLASIASKSTAFKAAG